MSIIKLFADDYHCVKYLKFTFFPGVGILWKDSFFIVSGEFLHREVRSMYGISRSVF